MSIDWIDDIDGCPMTTSVRIAQIFEKRPPDVNKKIRELLDDPDVQNYTCLHTPCNLFVEDTYIDSNGHERPMYKVSRDGFTLLGMSFTGKKALKFKLKYMEAFNMMEAFIMDIDRRLKEGEPVKEIVEDENYGGRIDEIIDEPYRDFDFPLRRLKPKKRNDD